MMTGQSRQLLMMLGIFLVLSFWLIFPGRAAAHCDALDGPVKHAENSVKAGREYVEAYVNVHYLEGIAKAVHAAPHHTENPSEASHQH